MEEDLFPEYSDDLADRHQLRLTSDFGVKKSQSIVIRSQLLGRRTITIIEGYKDGDKDECLKLGKKLKKILATGGTTKEDEKTGKYVIIFQGDRKHFIYEYLTSSKNAFPDEITMVGV